MRASDTVTNDPVDVVLVCMPFGPVFAPSIGLSLLKAGLARSGVRSRVRYFTIPFAERIGQDFYGGVSSYGRPPNRKLAGEWVFAPALFDEAADGTTYVREVLRGEGSDVAADSDRAASPALVQKLERARAAVPAFLELCLAEVLATRPRVVGFTSTFQQHVASLALAKRIKAASPDTFVVMGGANCEDAMGSQTVRSFPFVDAAVSGEADLVFPELARRMLDGRPFADMPGVLVRGRPTVDTAPMVRDMDSLPWPDYSDYFEQYARSRYRRHWQPSIFFETSRGCWWGAKQHCTFCGLNGTTMAYRSKSAARALEELAHLAEAHPDCDVQVTDNILDMRYLRDFVPALAARRLGVSLIYETKSNLTKAQLRQLAGARILTLQPGIESLSDEVLQRMRKGVSALQNVQLLKWCQELGITPYWNVLWGFPGEPAAEYARMARLVPLLVHLTPPGSFGRLRLDRFSPLFFDAERFGLDDVEPLAPYRHVYAGLGPTEVRNLAYYFSFRYREPQDVDGYTRPLARELRRWKRRPAGTDLFAVETGDGLLVCDTRAARGATFTVLRDEDGALLRASDVAAGLPSLAAAASLPAAEAEARLLALEGRRLVVRDGARWLALPIAPGAYRPAAATLERLTRCAGSAAIRATLRTLRQGGTTDAGCQEEADAEAQARTHARAEAEAQAEEEAAVRALTGRGRGTRG